MKQSRKLVCVLLCILVGTGMVFARGQRERLVEGPWVPSRPITLVVPWSPGGITDQVGRLMASEFERVLGQTIVVVNQPGASGATGTQNVLDAPHDGYTWLVGGSDQKSMYKLLGMVDMDVRDWHKFFCIEALAVVGVNADSPWQTFDQLLAHFRANPGVVPVGSSGVLSSGAIFGALLRQYTGITYNEIHYEGSGAVIAAVVSREVDINFQHVNAQADMIRAGRIRPLAAFFDEDFYLYGFGIIPSIRRYVPQMGSIGLSNSGVWLPPGTPPDVVETVTNAFRMIVPNNERIARFAEQHGLIFLGVPYYGPEGMARAREGYAFANWILYDAGLLRYSPSILGVPRP